MSKTQSLLSACDWSKQRFTSLAQIDSFPAVVKCVSNKSTSASLSTTLSPNHGKCINFNGMPPLLRTNDVLYLHERRPKQRYVMCQCIKFRTSNITNRIKKSGLNMDDVRSHVVGMLSIPVTYRGWFEVLSEDGDSVKPFGSIEEMLQVRIPTAFLLRCNIKVDLMIDEKKKDGDGKEDGEEIGENDESNTEKKQTESKQIVLKAGMKLTIKTAHDIIKNGATFITCETTDHVLVKVPRNLSGRFSSISKLENISGVSLLDDLCAKFRLPINVQLVYGRPPNTNKKVPDLPNLFRPILRLLYLYEDDYVLAYQSGSIEQQAVMIGLHPSNIPLMGNDCRLVQAVNIEQLRENSHFLSLKYHCSQTDMSNTMQLQERFYHYYLRSFIEITKDLKSMDEHSTFFRLHHQFLKRFFDFSYKLQSTGQATENCLKLHQQQTIDKLKEEYAKLYEKSSKSSSKKNSSVTTNNEEIDDAEINGLYEYVRTGVLTLQLKKTLNLHSSDHNNTNINYRKLNNRNNNNNNNEQNYYFNSINHMYRGKDYIEKFNIDNSGKSNRNKTKHNKINQTATMPGESGNYGGQFDNYFHHQKVNDTLCHRHVHNHHYGNDKKKNESNNKSHNHHHPRHYRSHMKYLDNHHRNNSNHIIRNIEEDRNKSVDTTENNRKKKQKSNVPLSSTATTATTATTAPSLDNKKKLPKNCKNQKVDFYFDVKYFTDNKNDGKQHHRHKDHHHRHQIKPSSLQNQTENKLNKKIKEKSNNKSEYSDLEETHNTITNRSRMRNKKLDDNKLDTMTGGHSSYKSKSDKSTKNKKSKSKSSKKSRHVSTNSTLSSTDSSISNPSITSSYDVPSTTDMDMMGEKDIQKLSKKIDKKSKISKFKHKLKDNDKELFELFKSNLVQLRQQTNLKSPLKSTTISGKQHKKNSSDDMIIRLMRQWISSHIVDKSSSSTKNKKNKSEKNNYNSNNNNNSKTDTELLDPNNIENNLLFDNAHPSLSTTTTATTTRLHSKKNNNENHSKNKIMRKHSNKLKYNFHNKIEDTTTKLKNRSKKFNSNKRSRTGTSMFVSNLGAHKRSHSLSVPSVNQIYSRSSSSKHHSSSKRISSKNRSPKRRDKFKLSSENSSYHHRFHPEYRNGINNDRYVHAGGAVTDTYDDCITYSTNNTTYEKNLNGNYNNNHRKFFQRFYSNAATPHQQHSVTSTDLIAPQYQTPFFYSSYGEQNMNNNNNTHLSNEEPLIKGAININKEFNDNRNTNNNNNNSANKNNNQKNEKMKKSSFNYKRNPFRDDNYQQLKQQQQQQLPNYSLSNNYYSHDEGDKFNNVPYFLKRYTPNIPTTRTDDDDEMKNTRNNVSLSKSHGFLMNQKYQTKLLGNNTADHGKAYFALDKTKRNLQHSKSLKHSTKELLNYS
ncbi:hypothetical protein SNEBB_006991 [Seison nebaliae]|nr:hypothetical protein SNEBB_006991 [Seison nebaliae]